MSTSTPRSDEQMSEVTYRGETISLSRTYADFHAYRDDPNNLPQREVPRVAALVKAAELPPRLSSRNDADDVLYKIMFPGYGLSMLQLDKPLALYQVEIPQSSQERIVVYGPLDGAWVLLDDFVWDDSAGSVDSVASRDGQLEYRDRAGKLLRVK